MFLLDSHPYDSKLIDSAIKYSEQNNLIGKKSRGLYIMKLQAQLSIHSFHFSTLYDIVYYFYLVFSCPHMGLPPQFNPANIRKF